MNGTGYAYEHPVAQAARDNPANWSIDVLMAGEPDRAVPTTFDCDLGPTINQGALGACVAFAATGVKAWHEREDEGVWRFTTPTALVAYDWLKRGHGSFPGDGIPDVEGSYPLAVWKLARAEGIPSTAQPRKITAYYQLATPEDADLEAFIAQVQQVIIAFGPVTVSRPWPANWFDDPGPDGIPPPPFGVNGGHMFVRKGWTTGPKSTASGFSPTGRYWRNRQSWGSWGRLDSFGRDAEFLTPFENDVVREAWKTVDLIDFPKPPAPEAPTVTIYDAAPRDQLADLPLGTQLYRLDGTPLVKLSSGGQAVWSPFATSATRRAVRISTGGVVQLALVASGDCRNLRPANTATPQQLAGAFNEGVSAAATAVAAVPRR